MSRPRASSEQGHAPVKCEEPLWETRRQYDDRGDYLDELRHRTGRSLLHSLDHEEIARLVEGLRERLPAGPLRESDRWTVWRATAA